jgi:hypothetical protein
MRIYRSEREGIEVLRISGVVGSEDAETISSRISPSAPEGGRCCILDFAGATHADFRAFEILERIAGTNPGVIFSGFNNYLLCIFAFVGNSKMTPVFSDWRKAFRYLKAEKGKLGEYGCAGREAAAGFPEVDGR